MREAIHVTAHVGPGHRIEIDAPELAEGEAVDVFIVRQPAAQAAEAPKGRPILEILASLGGHRLFQTAEEADAFLQSERDSWDR